MAEFGVDLQARRYEDFYIDLLQKKNGRARHTRSDAKLRR